jgi:hypothetical protein
MSVKEVAVFTHLPHEYSLHKAKKQRLLVLPVAAIYFT